MLTNKLLQTGIVGLGLLLLFSCAGKDKNEVIDHTPELIVGKWELQKATRNDRETESLTNLFFEFTEEGRIRTNLIGKEDGGLYTIEDKLVQQREGIVDIDYTINQISDSLLILSTTLRGFNFQFWLGRGVEEE